MKLVKSLLLGSATAFVAAAGAQAADLPSRKAAPASYVKVCDAYGAGFFYIPGTDTCIKIGGRVRADYAFSAAQNVFASAGALAGGNLGTSKNAVHTWGVEARGRVDLDARTPTAWGTVQTVLSLRMSRTSGMLSEVGPALSSNSASPTLEAAYIRFAGFTFGAAKDNFSFMPSTFYGAGHWASFANGAKQIAYTALLGGGISATVALQDVNDTLLAPVNVSAPAGVAYSYNNLPQIVANIAIEQNWGAFQVMGAAAKAVGVNTTATYDTDKTVWAVGAGAKINLPMLAAGDVLYLNAAYANGMTEYTTNWTSFKSSDVKRNVGGFVTNHPSYVYTATGIETLKSWVVAGVFTHYWAPSIRHSFLGSYGRIEGSNATKAVTFGTTGAFGDATVWNVGTQLAWLPVRNFEIGIEALYARVSQDIRRSTVLVTKEKEGNWTGRMRVERTF